MKAPSIRLERNVEMEMRDGVILRADIYRPSDRQKHAGILIRTPYNKLLNSWRYNSFLHFVEAVQAGYAVVFQDVRGRFASEGEWGGSNIFLTEGKDGYDSVEWMASQRWCDGNVGLSGISALAGLQWVTAMESPPHLKAIAPGCGGLANIGQGMQPRPESGAVSPAVLLSSIPGNAIEVADRLERQGQDVTGMRQAIQWVQSNPDLALNFLPLENLRLLQYKQIRATWDRLTRPISRGEQEKLESYEKVKTPCLHTVGWYDTLEWAVIESYTKMRSRGGSRLARQSQHLVVGPWWHVAWVDFLGAINFGPYADPLRAGVSGMHLAFYDRYLRGREIKIPAVKYFVMGRNRWEEALDWPLPQTCWQRFFLHSRGKANGAAGDGELSRDEPDLERPDGFSYDPLHPVPTVGGRYFGVGLVPGPLDQSQVEKRQDVLCYTTPELREELEASGPLEVHLFASSSARDTDFSARLVDVYPDGSAYNLVEGLKRAHTIKSVNQAEMIVPGEIYEYIIPLGNTSQLFRRGHRIRLEISSSNFPMFDRNMNTGNPIGRDASGIVAKQTIFHQSDYASYLSLPVIPVAAGDG